MTKNKLLSDGFISFNIKDVEKNLYNELRNEIPYQSQDRLLIPFINSFYLCQDFDILTSEFLNDFKKSYSDINENTIDKNAEIHALELSSQPIGSRRFLEMHFRANTLSELRNIKSFINNNYRGVKSQSWYQGHIEYKNFPTLFKIYEFVIKKYYDIDNQYYDNLFQSGISITCFEETDFIIPHKDGQNDGRYAGMLIYLNDDWKSEYGGQLVLKGKYSIEPEFGNIVLFDYTKNNIIHEVIEPIMDKSRFAVLTFVEI